MVESDPNGKEVLKMSNKRGSGPLQSIQNIRESTLTNLLAVVLAPLFVLEFNRYYASGSSFSGGSVVNIALFVVFVLLFRRTLRTGASAKKYGFGFALVLSAAMVIGKYLYVDDTIGYMFHSLENFLSTLLSILGFTLFWGLIFSIVFDYLLRKDSPLCGETVLWKLFAHKRAFFILWADSFHRMDSLLPVLLPGRLFLRPLFPDRTGAGDLRLFPFPSAAAHLPVAALPGAGKAGSASPPRRL